MRLAGLSAYNLVLLLIGGIGACAGPRSDVEASGGETRQESAVSDTTIEAAQLELTGRILPLSGVEGTAIGECGGEPCIKVYLSKTTDELLEQIPRSFRGYRVETEETGEIRPLPE